MSLFQCENCGCCENTALSCQGCRVMAKHFDWSGIEERNGMQICSACAPAKHNSGTPTGMGIWHDKFDRVFLPKGQFKTDQQGNLAHIETGDTDFRKYAVEPSN